MLLSCPAVLWFYARHLFLPSSVDEFYPLSYVEHATARTFLLPLAMLAIVLVVGWFWIRWLSRTGAVERRASWFAVGLITLPLLPVLDLRSLTVGDIVHDRHLYLPSVGFVLLLPLSLRELERRKWSPSFRAVTLIVAGLIAVWFAAPTVTQQAQWANDIQLYTPRRGVGARQSYGARQPGQCTICRESAGSRRPCLHGRSSAQSKFLAGELQSRIHLLEDGKLRGSRGISAAGHQHRRY
jgi:hypothetical protein